MLFYLNINQLDALKFYNEFISRLYMFRAQLLIVRRPKLYYTVWYYHTYRGPSRAQVIQASPNLCTRRPPTGVMIPETVEYNFGLLTMSTCA
jgi:hypothetical protein